MHSNGKKANPIVFISYAHERDLSSRVEQLADWLIGKGVQVITDHPYKNRPPKIGWRSWMQQNIEDADIILIVCSERYKRLFEKREVVESGGYGVTWESAVITNDLYQSRLKNQRFYPILPDDGDHEHVPAVLMDWHNNHRFPSGMDRILSLIRDEIIVPAPTKSIQHLFPGELSGKDDPRLQPREGEVIGRDNELAEVLSFLNSANNSAAVCAHITGSGGIGKTEVCKGALKQWLSGDKATRTFWLQVSDDADTRKLLGQLGEAVGLAPENSAKINEASQLRPHLPAGLYYFDNLESVAESQRGIKLLREMIQIPGIRILASSRVTLDGVLGSSIFVGKLDTASAVKLFLKCWSGFSAPDAQELNEFVDKQLGGHALSITLLSRLGRAYSWQALQQQWFKQGTAIAKSRKASDRLDSLEISFALTAKLLAEEPGALNLWQFAALFSDGFDEETLNMWCEISGHSQARIALFDHHLLINTNGCITMLPPIARFASGHTAIADSEYAFDWNNARKYAYHYFLDLSRNASKIISDDVNVESRIKSSQQLWAIDQLLSTDINFSSPDIELIKRLHSQLRNVYSFNVLAGQAVLGRVNQLIGDALSKKLLGDLERRLGNVDQARGHYDHAIELYQKEQDQLGLANALQALGDLESRLGNVDQARGHYVLPLRISDSGSPKMIYPATPPDSYPARSWYPARSVRFYELGR